MLAACLGPVESLALYYLFLITFALRQSKANSEQTTHERGWEDEAPEPDVHTPRHCHPQRIPSQGNECMLVESRYLSWVGLAIFDCLRGFILRD